MLAKHGQLRNKQISSRKFKYELSDILSINIPKPDYD